MTDFALPVDSSIEFILTKEPSFIKLDYEPSSPLAIVPDFLQKEFRVPMVSGTSSPADFWKCANEFEAYHDLTHVISEVQAKISGATASLRDSHASWLAAHASSFRSVPTDFGANTALAAYQTALRALKNSTNTYWNYKFLLRALEGPIPATQGTSRWRLSPSCQDRRPA